MAMPVRESNATIRRQRSKPHLSNHPLHFTLSTPGLILQPEAPQWSPWASDVSLTPASIMSEDSVLSKDNQIIWNSMIGTDTPATSIESPAPSRLNVSIPEALTPIIEATPASVPAVAVARQDLDIDSLLLALAPGTIPLGGRQRDKIQHAYCICISSQWLRNHEHEPRDGCGRSIFLLFLAPTGAGAFQKCLFHGCHGIYGRQDRALAHIRSHFEHRPFACLGECGDVNCLERFYSAAYLRSHLQRPKVACELCGTFVVKTALRRHTAGCRRNLVRV
ncbi:hypothetical protein PIIN_07380 [Serendipita indica DSM 11827]|uniref:C2H2-type domain-containing protein n=1 Tax=Serendipita indica (strain DSM 11827) TaxID=1109443 RepID=G4TQ33_SERID|nr:hypothetical protein PIIN_07380 [Serendipita indica DSM 11827]